MAELTVAGARAYVRTYLDTDAEELPDVLLDVFMDEALTRVDRAARRWRFQQASYGLTTVANQQTHTFASVDATLRDVTVVEGPRWVLEPISHEIARAQWANYDGTSEPTHWSVWEDTLYLWPTPNDAYALEVRGYRSMARPADSGTPFDFPEDFHTLIAEYMLARAYEQQDDDLMARQKFERFEANLDALKRRWETPPSGTVIFGGDTRRHPWRTFTNLPPRLIYDWE